MARRTRSLVLILPATIVLSWPAELSAEGESSDSRNAFSQPLPTLDFEGLQRFREGNLLFRKLWVSAPSAFPGSDGLGPLFNARSCQSCHVRDGRGRLPEGTADSNSGLVLHLSLAGRPEPTYGRQLQTMAVPGLSVEGRISVTYSEFAIPIRDEPPVTLRDPQYRISSAAFGPMFPGALLSPRIAQQLIGLGMLAAIPDEALLANADPEDRDGDGISGRANLVSSIEGGQIKLGRFGHKAGLPDLRDQTATALMLDLGLSTDLYPAPWGDCTKAEVDCRGAPNGETPGDTDPREVSRKNLDDLTFYTASLAVPSRRNPDAPLVMRGETVFGDAGCASCHVKEFQVPTPGQGKTDTIQPYTDLLLHDMGPGLADGLTEGLATGTEWRTAPLWGIGLTEAVSGQIHLLHDGRARTLLEAILWHGGEAEASRNRVAALPPPDRAALIAFLESL
ncbi:thiol oxidoreductase [Tabrizicola sp. J26]|uniref:di-heme oxidoreductase family protein n=1 Tax=Alitabrizicola rongguiensis TaxID=2909234 RepID=UPI001F1C3759|nr:di-heme oxidoredictase family protein [Tabrizicola rongguiensis]MCF1708118.1 thiol oxidoreductase [Tabrizicola rongguiensis]